jgi:hypothetical protein
LFDNAYRGYLIITLNFEILVMSDNNNAVGDHTYTAPTYDELLQQVKLLADQVAVLRATTTPPVAESCVEAVDYRLLPDLDRSVPAFTGRKPNHVAEDWIESVDGLATINNWPLRYRLQYVRANVVGAARNWFLSEDFKDWDELIVKFRQAFVRQVRQSDRWETLTKRDQGPSELIVDYFYVKLRLCRALDLPFSEVRDHIIQGIRSFNMSQYAMSRTHLSPSELLADLQEWERMAALRQRFKMVSANSPPMRQYRDRPVNSTIDVRDEKVQDTSVKPVASKPVRSSEPNHTVQCYNCRKFGHISRDCPSARRTLKCTYCESDQHTRGRCPRASDQSKPPSTGALWASVPSRTPPVNPFVKSVQLNGITVTGLIDTGCSNVLI